MFDYLRFFKELSAIAYDYQQPPDLDRLIQEWVYKLKRKFSGLSGKGPGGKDRGWKAGWWIVGVLLALWLLTGLSFIAPEEQGVMLVFGKQWRVAQPGPNWNFPVPIGRTLKPKVTRIRKIEVGFRSIQRGRETFSEPVTRESWMLTGDENIVSLDFIVQYRIRDALKFLFKLRDPEGTLKDTAESAMREVIGRTEIDRALTEGKGEIQLEAQNLIQKTMDDYESGIQVVTVKLQDVDPPDPVNDAFRDVINAQQDKERMINEAKGFENDIIPAARGRAAQVINEAEAYRQARVTEAEGEAQRFTALLSEYNRAKEVTKRRMYLETMENILQGVEKFVLDSKGASNALPFLPLKGLNESQNPATGGGKP